VDLRLLWDKSGLFPEYRKERFDPDRPNADVEAWNLVEDYRKDPNRGLLIVGPPGTGKTLMAHEVARDCLERRERVRAVRFDQYMAQVQTMMTLSRLGERSPEAADEWMTLYRAQQELQESTWLLLDDVGAEHRTDSGWSKDQLSLLLRSRGDRKRPTIVTTNIPVGQWAGVYGDSTASYIHQVFVVVTVSGPDIRRGRR
jgi:DNA replication protein DnaC